MENFDREGVWNSLQHHEVVRHCRLNYMCICKSHVSTFTINVIRRILWQKCRRLRRRPSRGDFVLKLSGLCNQRCPAQDSRTRISSAKPRAMLPSRLPGLRRCERCFCNARRRTGFSRHNLKFLHFAFLQNLGKSHGIGFNHNGRGSRNELNDVSGKSCAADLMLKSLVEIHCHSTSRISCSRPTDYIFLISVRTLMFTSKKKISKSTIRNTTIQFHGRPRLRWNDGNMCWPLTYISRLER